MLRSDRPLPLVPISSAAESTSIETLFRTHHTAIRRYIARTFGAGPPDPEDVVQAAFEKYASLGAGSQIDNPKAFLVRTARNYVLDHHRRQAVRASHAQSIANEGVSRDDFDGERVLTAKQRWAVLESAIRALDERHQEMLVMNRIHGLSYAEIARQKACSQTLVKTIVARALAACEQALRQADGD